MLTTVSYGKAFLKRFLSDRFLVQLRAIDYRLHSVKEFDLLPKLCDRHKCSVDVGANVGVITYFLARYSSHVYAYEPNPDLASKLGKAFRKNVTVTQAALSDHSGSITLKVPTYSGVEMHELASVAQDFDDADAIREFMVPMRRLDDEELKNVGFVKIDVEQHEAKVLRGAMRLFRDQKPNILLEVTPKLYSQSLSEFLADVLGLGYWGYFIYDGTLMKLDDYRLDRHNRSENYGVGSKYVTNVVLSNQPLVG